MDGQWNRVNWNGQRAYAQNGGVLSAVVLPGLGGKIASLYHHGARFEAAAQSSRGYRPASYGANFSEYDASGLDDGFPTLHACADKPSGLVFPDHGEIWSASMDTAVEDRRLVLRYESAHHPYRYEKRVGLENDSLMLDYRIENTGRAPYPCLWAFHGLLRYGQDMEIVYPPNAASFLNVLDSSALGPAGRVHAINGGYNFAHVPPPGPPSMLKYYLNGRAERGSCGFRYPQEGMECLLKYDAEILPYLGVWITAGGFRGEYNCALEPCNGFYDDISTARKQGALFQLMPGCPLVFSLGLRLRKIGPGGQWLEPCPKPAFPHR